NNQNIKDLLDSFKANDYLPVDQIQVRPLDAGGYIVVEGNRRVATLKYLQSEYEQKGIELGQLNSDIFRKVPVVLYTDSDEMHHLTLMALKHISGNKKWGEWNQAKLLDTMHSTYGISEEEICKRVAISKVELRRSLRALSFLQQYQASDYGDQFKENKFPLFREIVRNRALKEWLAWDDDEYKSQNAHNCEFLFSLISTEPQDRYDDDENVSYGDAHLEPALVTRDDIRLLGEIINDEKALEQLKLTRDINAAYRSSHKMFREHQQAAIKLISNEIDTLGQMVIKGESLPEIESAFGRLQGIINRAKASSLGSFVGVEQKTVFHDRIEAHFSELLISNYKRLQNIKISKLSRINLFTGINNSGKTTLLEAIYLLCRQNDFFGLLEVIRRRGKIAEDKIAPEWFIEQIPQEIFISGQFDNSDSEVRIKHYKEENSRIDKSHYLESVEIYSCYATKSLQSLTRIFKGQERETQADHIKILCPSAFSSPFFLNEPHRYAQFHYKSVQSKSLPKIVEFIREKVVGTIEDIRLADEKQRFLVTDSVFKETLDLTGYGEGLQRIFFISLLFASAQNGIILIDEFENAIHTKLIVQFAELIDELSNIFNTQVFLTSHSKECIDAFVKNMPQIDDLSACALVENEDRIKAREFTGKEFRRLVEAGNVDLRSAK
ncbi:AAA family ATPase, partial [Candidatus Marithioploca araucensis]|nr:AAA family ATPase [Candidatus Marithioploca araucensis]